MFIEAHQPRTFRERGVAAPFTTPLLAGARLRGSPTRRGTVLETIIPNPAGCRGVYILAWTERGDLCRTTVHDTLLGNALAERTDLSLLCPAMVRLTGWEVAAAGHAGGGAASAAQSMLRDRTARLATVSSHLNAALARHLAGAPSEPLARDRLAAVLAEIHASDGAPGRVASLVRAVGNLAAALPAWAATQSGPDSAAAQRVAAAAELAYRGAVYLLRGATDRLEQPAILLREWLTDPAGVEQALSRSEWLLDGWERLVRLSQLALPGSAAAVLEMAALLPVWPDETDAWLNLPPGTTARLASRHVPPAKRIADPAITLDQIARNERLRALET